MCILIHEHINVDVVKINESLCMCVHMSICMTEPGLTPWFIELQNSYLPESNLIEHHLILHVKKLRHV